jgi:1,4-alpha-glucan branching enzyme
MTDQDLYLFNEGSHFRLYDKLGAHLVQRDNSDGNNFEQGTHFAVWAPDANHVSVIGDFNDWDKGRHPLLPQGQSGIWEGFIASVGKGALYKYHIGSRFNGYAVDKADPYSIFNEIPPKFASIVRDL